jgi:hypothetical protein
MKKIAINLLSVIAALLFVICSCDDKVEDICNDTKEILIERSFVLSAKVQYEDYVPYEGKIYFEIYKRYCNATRSGEYNADGIGNAEGYWFTGMQYIYKFENSLDRVEVEFRIVSPFSGIDDKIVHESFYYIDAYDYLHEINKTYEITLPWRSDEK